MMDISTRSRSMHTAKLLSNIQQDLAALFTSTLEAIILIESNGTILAANNVSAKWLGQRAEALVGNNLFQLLTPFGIPIREWVHEVTVTKSIFESDSRLNERYTHLRLIPITESNKVRRLIIVSRDVTEQKRAEEDVREFTEQMEHKVRKRTNQLETLTRKLAEGKRHAELRASLSQHLVQNTQDYKQLLEHITTELSDLIGDTCLIALFTPNLTVIEIQALTNRTFENLPQRQQQMLNQAIPIKPNDMISRILQGKRYSAKKVANDAENKTLPQNFIALLGNHELTALEVFPLHIGRYTLGLLAMARKYGNPYSKEDVSFVASLTGTIALAIQNARLFEKLTERENQLRGLSQKLVQVQENQFRQLAGEMHDQIGQDMTAINVNINILQNMLPKTISKEIITRLADTEELVQESVKRMRSLMAEFRPPMLDQYGLTAALYWYSDQFHRRTNINVITNDRYMQSTRLPSEVEIAFFRIVQEALTNVVKHANATQVDIELFAEAGMAMMSITDNGKGFNMSDKSQIIREHWGLTLMKERARAVGGEFLLRSVPGQGTQIIVRAKVTT